MNAACKQWWQDHSDELTEWDWDSFRRVWEAAQLSVVAPFASHNNAMDAIATQVQTIARNADISPYDRLDKIVTLVMSQRHQ